MSYRKVKIVQFLVAESLILFLKYSNYRSGRTVLSLNFGRSSITPTSLQPVADRRDTNGTDAPKVCEHPSAESAKMESEISKSLSASEKRSKYGDLMVKFYLNNFH
jgi:hypothetical protein